MKRSVRIAIAFVTWMLIFFLLLTCSSADATDNRITVFLSSDDEPFRIASEAFSQHISKNTSYTYTYVNLDGDTERARNAVRRTKKEESKMVITLGSLATETALQNLSSIPIVGCLVLRTDILSQSGYATGIGIEFPFEAQFRWINRVLPRARSVGLLYTPGENQERVRKAVEIAQGVGLHLEAFAVNRSDDIPAALKSLSRRVEAILVIPDSLILEPSAARTILTFSFRNNIPVVGPSESWVKAGALYALDWDFADLGVQCAEMAERILAGTHPQAIAPESPRTVHYTINLLSAQQLKIELSDELVRGARRTY